MTHTAVKTLFSNSFHRKVLDDVEVDVVKAEVGVISLRLRQINANRGLDNSRYHAKTEFNNHFINIHIRFIRTSYKFNYFDMQDA